MKIGILQCGHIPDALRGELEDYDQLFLTLLGDKGFEFEVFPVVDGAPIPAPDACDGWLITGSRHGAYEDHAWIPPLEALIRQIHAEGRPLVGICFGHQIIAQALGGKVEKFAGGWSVGRQVYTIEGEDIPLNAWHQDQVTELPADARVIGSTDFCKYAALAYGDHIYTVQPHPEFGADVIDGLIRTRGRGNVPDPLLDAAVAQLDAPLARTKMADRMAAVLKGEKA
ncbi:type 1 glutamine amidotransferase [Pseudooceanicola nanhaiensis]|uniref:type 1 glutamine amidotransferase n=1 Tax=Pseudooceanicola nanhaiensis TaxID=375761 RepID=UPI001CD6CD98|nr:type 1 glutamine amidotransferase [Pseudooceanicola nanhaiensis]MCA0921751.1 type 1 glutamine amidotransferase [Pseudooceanicola nanhaiensis]